MVAAGTGRGETAPGAWGLVPSGACAARSPNGVDRMQTVNPGGRRELRCDAMRANALASRRAQEKEGKKTGFSGDTAGANLHLSALTRVCWIWIVVGGCERGREERDLGCFPSVVCCIWRCCTNRKSGSLLAQAPACCAAAPAPLRRSLKSPGDPPPHSPAVADLIRGTATLRRGPIVEPLAQQTTDPPFLFIRCWDPGQGVTIEIHRIEICRHPPTGPGRCDLSTASCI